MDCVSRAPPPFLKHFGMGLPECGFFGIVGGDGVVVATPPPQNAVVISVLDGNVSLEIMAAELKEWGMDGWDWQLEALSANELEWCSPLMRASAW